jgi:LysR family carnitine catabolism transcriptional activator
VELTWCRSFVAVYELGGFSAAARSLHRAQSRISAHVAALEQIVGEPLLNRDVHPPTLTRAGETFLPHARAAIAEWTAAVGAVTSLSGRIKGTLALGAVPSVSSQIIAPLISAMSAVHPGLTFELHEGPNSWLDDALAHRAVEACIRPIVEQGSQAGVIRRPLLTDRFVVVARPDHELAAFDVVPLAKLAGFPVITTGEAGLDARVGLEYRQVLAPISIDRARSMAVTQPTTVFALVRAGVGVGLIGSLAADMIRDDSLVSRPVDEPNAQREIGVYWAGTRQLSAAAQVFLEEVRGFVAQQISAGRYLPPGAGVR